MGSVFYRFLEFTYTYVLLPPDPPPFSDFCALMYYVYRSSIPLLIYVPKIFVLFYPGALFEYNGPEYNIYNKVILKTLLFIVKTLDTEEATWYAGRFCAFFFAGMLPEESAPYPVFYEIYGYVATKITTATGYFYTQILKLDFSFYRHLIFFPSLPGFEYFSRSLVFSAEQEWEIYSIIYTKVRDMFTAATAGMEFPRVPSFNSSVFWRWVRYVLYCMVFGFLDVPMTAVVPGLESDIFYREDNSWND